MPDINTAFLNSVSDLQNITWGSSTQWDIKFGTIESYGLPEHFQKFFPAVSVNQTIATFDFANIEYLQAELEIPVASKARFVDIDFIDDANHSLEFWLTDWFTQIFPEGGKYISPIKTIARELLIAKLNRKKEQIRLDHHMVVPYRDMAYKGDSENQPQHFSARFLIVSTFNTSPHGG